ncbi:MAG: hypothetical protein ACTSP3_00605 [Candidatus Heimdallarchaeaceae archaeon]
MKKAPTSKKITLALLYNGVQEEKEQTRNKNELQLYSLGSSPPTHLSREEFYFSTLRQNKIGKYLIILAHLAPCSVQEEREVEMWKKEFLEPFTLWVWVSPLLSPHFFTTDPYPQKVLSLDETGLERFFSAFEDCGKKSFFTLPEDEKQVANSYTQPSSQEQDPRGYLNKKIGSKQAKRKRYPLWIYLEVLNFSGFSALIKKFTELYEFQEVNSN